MSFDITDLFRETEDALTELDEGNELAILDFANRILAMPTYFTSIGNCEIYQDVSVIKYAQWVLTNNKELGLDWCLDALYQYASGFWYAETPVLTKENVKSVFEAADNLFCYSQKVLCGHLVDLLLIDAQHECRNAETTAILTPEGMRSCICIYRMQNERFDPVHVLLHEMGHLIHIRMTGTMTEVPASFTEYLSRLGVDYKKRTEAELRELFADTFLLAVIAATKQFGDPLPDVSEQAKRLCREYVTQIFNELP